MNVLLIVPPVDYTYDIYPPLGLLNLASMIRDKHQVEILDCIAKKIKIKDAIKHVKQNIDVIGVSNNYTNNTHNVISIAKQIKKKFPRQILICGGTSATFDSEYLLNNCFDFVVRHEGEITFRELISHLDKGYPNLNEIRGIWYNKNNKIYRNKDRPLIKNLDNLPLPSWDMIDEELYNDSYIGKQSMIETGRGCAFSCNYCVSSKMWKHTHRYKSPKRIALEFKLAKERGICLLLLYPDENFTTHPKKVIDICKELIKQKNSIPWISGGRSDTLARNPNLAKYIKEAGCKIYATGYESNNNEILKKYNKKTSKELNKKALSILKNNGLVSIGSIIVGAPNETFKQLKDTIKFSLKLDFASYSILRPYPGTIYWNEGFRNKTHLLNGSLCLLHNHPFMIELSQKIAVLLFYFRFKTLKRLFSKNKYEKYLAKKYYKLIYSILLYTVWDFFKNAIKKQNYSY